MKSLLNQKVGYFPLALNMWALLHLNPTRDTEVVNLTALFIFIHMRT